MARSVDGRISIKMGLPPTPGQANLADLAVIAPDWVPETAGVAAAVVEAWTQRKIGALLRERGLDDEVETTRRFVLETIPEYADRFLLELLQNAHDALPATGKGRIHIELDLDAQPNGELLVANSGTPFRFRDFRSLCRMAQSEKRPGEAIGHKGVGFKSVLQVAPQPEIYSAAADGSADAFEGFCFTFPDESRYGELLAGADENVPQMTPYSLPVAIPVPDQPASVRRLAADGYSTVIRLPLASLTMATARRAIEEVVSSSAPVLLFLHRIGELTVRIQEDGAAQEHHLTRTTTTIASGRRARVERVDLAEAGSFLLATGEADEATFLSAIADDVEKRRTSERWLEWSGAPEVSVAVPLGPRTDDRLYCYLPMHSSAQSPLAGHVNAPFAIGLARKEAILDSRINEVLFDAAADVSVDAASELVGHPRFRPGVVDLIAWPRNGARVVDAIRRRGEDPGAMQVLPVLGDQGWASFSVAQCWDPQATTQLTTTAVASLVHDQLVDPAIGQERLKAIVSFGSANLKRDLEPPPGKIADWAEAVAQHLHRRERVNTPPATEWVDFYDDLSRAFPGTSGRALAGKRILLGEDKELLATWSEPDATAKRDGSARGVFFARTALDDPETDATENNSVPSSLRRAIARMHPDLDWFVPGEAGRRNRPGRVFLEQQGLVQVPRIPDLLRLVERVAKGTRTASVWRDAIVFVYRITRPGPRRPDLRSLGLERLGLRVPANGNWVPSQRALFSRGWTNLGALLSDLVDSAGPVSSEVAELGARLLDPAETWVPKRTALDGWIELLRYCGVGDGLRPVVPAAPPFSVTFPGWRLHDPKHIAERCRITEADRTVWSNVLELGSWPMHDGAEYVADGSPARIPCQSDYDRFPDKARSAFAHLVLVGLTSWADSVFSFEVRRRVGQGDAKRLPSPAKAFLASAPWLRVSRPGSGGEDEWVAPADAWLIHASENEPFFAPVLDARFRADIAGSQTAQARLVELGAHFWSDRDHAIAKLLLLGRLLHEGRVLPGLIAQVRNSIADTWKSVVDDGPSLSLDSLKNGFLSVSRREQIDTLPASSGEPYFVRGYDNRMLELVLASIGEPVLVAGGDVGQKIWTKLHASGFSAARLIWPSDLVVEVDGQPARNSLEDSEPLVAGDRTWLSDLVALTLELKPTEFRPPSQRIVQNAVERLGDIRLVAGQDLVLVLDGQRQDVPAHSRGVVPTVIDGHPVIVWVRDDEALTWRGLQRMAPAIAELIQERGIRDALENVVRALGEGGDTLEEPADAQLADVFGVPEARIGELRRSYRGAVSKTLFLLVPLVACLCDASAAANMRTRTIQGPNPDQGLIDALEQLRERLPSSVTVEVLLEAARSSRRIGEAREKLGIGFAEMNSALLQLGPEYVAETHPDLHAVAMSAYLARERDRIVDSLRVAAINDWLDDSGTYDRYAGAVKDLDSAVRVPRLPAKTDLLAPDPDWLVDYLEPPDHLLKDRVDLWVASRGAPPLGASSGLTPASILRASNGKFLAALLPRVALVIRAWIDRHGVSAPSEWTNDTGALVQELAASGQLDFAEVNEAGAIALLAGRQAWPVEMDRTTDLTILHMTETDLIVRRTEDASQKAVAERARRGVEVAGQVVTLDPDTIGLAMEHVFATIAQSSLAVPVHEVALGSPPAGRNSGGSGGSGGKKGGQGRVPNEKLETIGLIGEAVAWAWLSHHYGQANVMWRSRNRAFVIHDGEPGDDQVGFDFEVQHGRSRLFYEVKAHMGDPRDFELSEPEVRFAMSKASTATYRVLYIGNVNTPTERVILPLPNPLGARARANYRALESGIKYTFATVET